MAKAPDYKAANSQVDFPVREEFRWERGRDGGGLGMLDEMFAEGKSADEAIYS